MKTLKFPKIKSVNNQLVKAVHKNSPVILTGVGVIGVIGTAYLTGKASFEAADVLRQERIRKITSQPGPVVHAESPEFDSTTGEKIKLLWKLYMPAIGVGALACAAIVCSNRISTRRTAAMATALTISERAYSEYKEKTEEIVGKNKEEKIRTAVAQDKVDALPENVEILNTGKGDVLFLDAYSGRPFLSSMEEVKAAINNVNSYMLKNDSACLSDVYDWLALDHTKISNDIGWTRDKLIEPKITSTIFRGDRPCMVLDFSVGPYHGYDSFRGAPIR